MTRYWVLVANEFATEFSQKLLADWAGAGLTLIDPPGPWQGTSARWLLFEDPGAPPELQYQTVELVFTRQADGTVTITDRQVTGR